MRTQCASTVPLSIPTDAGALQKDTPLHFYLLYYNASRCDVFNVNQISFKLVFIRRQQQKLGHLLTWKLCWESNETLGDMTEISYVSYVKHTRYIIELAWLAKVSHYPGKKDAGHA